jgi:hypothetical protein
MEAGLGASDSAQQCLRAKRNSPGGAQAGRRNLALGGGDVRVAP